MNKEKLKIGDNFKMNGISCSVTKVDHFGSTKHYGVIFEYDNGKIGSGWIPCLIAESIGELYNAVNS